MSKFDDWFKQYDGNNLTDAATYFVKPMLRDAFNAGRQVGKPAKEPKQ